MRYQQAFFIGNKLHGFAERAPLQLGMVGNVLPPSYVFFCRTCGEIWARCPVEDTLLKCPTEHQVQMVRCQKHPGPEELIRPAGSLWLWWDEEFCNALPDSIIRQEFSFIQQQLIEA